MLELIDRLVIKAALVPPQLPPPTALEQLLAAKAESDRRNYVAKNAILRRLLLTEPHNFVIDSENHGIVGLTHTPNNFKIHMPRVAMPTAVKLEQLAKITP